MRLPNLMVAGAVEDLVHQDAPEPTLEYDYRFNPHPGPPVSTRSALRQAEPFAYL